MTDQLTEWRNLADITAPSELMDRVADGVHDLRDALRAACDRIEALEFEADQAHAGRLAIIHAVRERAEAAEADADALGKTALEQAERAKKAEARVEALDTEFRVQENRAANFAADCAKHARRIEALEGRLKELMP